MVNVEDENGLSFNYSQAQKNVRITSYPTQAPYLGVIPYSCYRDTIKASDNDAKMSCGFTGFINEASSRVWFRTLSSNNVGHILQ